MKGVRADGRGRWVVRAGAVDPRTGKLVRRQRTVVGTKREAEAELTKLRAEIVTGPSLSRSVPRLREYAESWLRRCQPRVSEATHELYRFQLSFPTAAMGDVYLDKITRGDVEDLVATLVREGLAPSTVNRILVVLKAVLSAASDEFGFNDPARRVRALPAPGRKEGLSVDQLQRALEAARRHLDGAHYPLVVTLAFTGLRWSELSALRWEDIDQEAGVIRIRRSQRRGRLRGATKTGDHRTVPLVAIVGEALRERRARLLRDQPPGLDAGWIWWTRSRRGPGAGEVRFLDQTGVQPLWTVLAAAAGVRVCRPHVLRRTFVDLQRRARVDAIVARATVGHEGEAMTAHYSTVRDDEIAEAGAAVLRLVMGGEK